METDLYLRLRKKEGHLYSDDIVARLPFILNGDPLADEWKARSASASRLIRYLSPRPNPLHILDMGCGNGWLSNMLSITSLGFPEMAEHYFHHRLSDLDVYHPKRLYHSQSLKHFVNRWLGRIDSPFPWILIKK